MASESLTAGEDLWDERSPEEPEGALLCERPALVLPLPHEEQIHRHGLTVPSSQNTALEESQSTHREVKTLVTKKKNTEQTATFADVSFPATFLMHYCSFRYLKVSAMGPERNPDLHSSPLQANLESPLCMFRLAQSPSIHSHPHASVSELTVD